MSDRRTGAERYFDAQREDEREYQNARRVCGRPRCERPVLWVSSGEGGGDRFLCAFHGGPDDGWTSIDGSTP